MVKPQVNLADLKSIPAAKTLWQVNTGQGNKNYERLYPFVEGQQILTAGNGSVKAWNLNNGAGRWSTEIGEHITAGVNGGDGRAFVGTNDGSIVALDSETGIILWVRRIGNEILSISAVVDNYVVFQTSDGHLTAMNADSGKLAWKQLRSSNGITLRGASTPIISEGLVISGSANGTITAVKLNDGQLVWESVLSVPRGSNELERITDIDGRMKNLGSALFAVAHEGQIAGIKLESGEVVWANRFASPAGVDANPQGLYTVSQTGEVWRFDPQSGEPLWKMAELSGYSPGTPIIDGSNIVLTDSEGYLNWIEQEKGTIIARSKGDNASYTTPPVVVNDRVYSFGRSGILAAHSVR